MIKIKKIIKYCFPIWLQEKLKVLIYGKNIKYFYDYYFSIEKRKLIIQVGANDGVSSDPLCDYFKVNNNFHAILIEPHPFYVNKLKKMYKERSNIQIEQVACGDIKNIKDLYFIQPEIADEMNGDGPNNNWAHGQGSFDKNIIIHHINQNKFRGKDYVKNIPNYINAIQSIETKIIRLMDLNLDDLNFDNFLLVIDVQGFEIEVLKGIDWRRPPRFIVFEDDLNNGKLIHNYLISKEYKFVLGNLDKLYCKKEDYINF
jgi:FkbM family methyltransferase